VGFQACLNTNCASNRLHRAGIPHVQSRLASPTPDIPLQSGQNPDLPRTCLGVSKADSFPSTIHQLPLRGGKGWPTLGPFQLQKLVGETISYHSGGLKNPSPGETPKGGLGDRECGHKTEARGHSFTHPPLANSPQHSGSTYPWAKTFFLSESSFLAQREPGLKPRSRWGLSVVENGSLLSHQPAALQPWDRPVSQQPLLAASFRLQHRLCPPVPGRPWSLSSQKANHSQGRRESEIPVFWKEGLA
jgi:hypothetical protein